MSGPECCSNPPILDPNYGAGHVQKLGGLNSYITGLSCSKHAILLVSEVFGYEAPILRKLADKIAAKGYYVVVPDFLYGDPFAYENASRPLPVWLKDHEPYNAFEDAKPVIEALRSMGALAIGAASFCWGGAIVLNIENSLGFNGADIFLYSAKCVVELAKSGMIQAAVLFHPSLVTVDDIKGVNTPIAILGAEIDQYCPPELVKQFEEILTAQLGDDCYVKVVPKVCHGWTVRYNMEDAEAVMAAEAAHQKLLAWFDKHVH